MLDTNDIAEMKAEIQELRRENGRLEDEAADLRDEIKDLEEADCDECDRLQAEIEEMDDPDVYIDALGEVRRMIARGEYSEAIDYADRFLPKGMRYAA